MLSPEELHRRGVDALNRGRHAVARRCFERAAAGLGPGDLLARIEASQAYLLSETGQARAAADLCALALTRPGLSEATRGVLHSQEGLLHMLRGESPAALASFDAAVALIEDAEALGHAHLNRGGVHLQQGDARSARDDFRRSDRFYRQVGDEYGAAKALHNLGYSELLEGDLVGALRDLAAAYETFVDEGPVMTAMADQDRAEALMAAGLVEEGREALERAARAYGRRRLYQRQGEAELALARTLVTPQPARALEAARRARARFVRSDTPVWRDRAESLVLAAQVELGRSGPRLVERGDALSVLLAGHGLRWVAASTNLYVARALVARGDLDGAATRLRRHPVTAAAPLDVRLLDHDTRAALHAARGRRAPALARLRLGLAELHDWQSSFGSLDLQTNVVGHGVLLARRGLRLAAGSESPVVLLEWSERARMLASRVQPARAPQDEQVVADLAELRDSPTPAREQELRRRVRERAWRARGSSEVVDPVSPVALQAALGPDTALVAHVVGGEDVVAVVVTDTTLVRRHLGRRADVAGLLGGLAADLDVAAATLPPPIASSVRRGLETRLAALADLLVVPLLGDLGTRQVVLTPSGLLAGVPWPLLEGLRGRPVTLARSATTWSAGRSPTTGPTTGPVAGFVAGPRVPRAEAEVGAAAAGWPDPVVLVGPDATAAAVSALAARVDVLHVAAHGRHSADNPLFSGLELADGSWYGYDIDQLGSVPRVVLLSACEVGRSSVRHGEELIGMATAWLHAGARWVVASPSAVADDVAHDTLLALHAGLRAGLDPPAALAAVEHRRDGAPAPFVCFT